MSINIVPSNINIVVSGECCQQIIAYISTGSSYGAMTSEKAKTTQLGWLQSTAAATPSSLQPPIIKNCNNNSCQKIFFSFKKKLQTIWICISVNLTEQIQRGTELNCKIAGPNMSSPCFTDHQLPLL